MKRLAVALLLVLALMSTRARSHAQTAGPPIYCYNTPTYTYVPCTPTAAPTAPPITPDKALDVSGPVQENPEISQYLLTITSRLACFPLQEPVDVFTVGNVGEAVLSPATPGSIPIQKPDTYQLSVDPLTGQAELSLEVWGRAVGPQGLGVKAFWPEENVDRVAQILAPPAPTPTATRIPGTPNSAIPPPPTTTTSAEQARFERQMGRLAPLLQQDETSTPTATATSSPSTPTATPASGAGFFVRACVTPNPTAGAPQATVWAQSVPGAVCSAAVRFSNGTTAPDLASLQQTIPDTTVAGAVFDIPGGVTGGTATVTCSYAGYNDTASADFTVSAAPPTPTSTAVSAPTATLTPSS